MNYEQLFWQELERYHYVPEMVDRHMRWYYPMPKDDFRWDRPIRKAEIQASAKPLIR